VSFWTRRNATVVAFLIFALALASRLPGLDLYITNDEQTNVVLGAVQFIKGLLNGDLRATYWHFYPGTTLSWMESLGITVSYLWAVSQGYTGGIIDFLNQDIRTLILAGRVPVALSMAASVGGMYLLVRRLLDERVALLAGAIIALDPFFLAHSRVAHVDAPVTACMTLSLLALLLCWQEEVVSPSSWGLVEAWHRIRKSGKLGYLVFSAVMAGLALLGRQPAGFLFLFVALLTFVGWGIQWQRSGRGRLPPPWSWGVMLALWAVLAAAIFFILWPAMWVDPAWTLGRMWRETFGKVEAGHLTYFFGTVSLDPGPWFYPYIVAFRLTPLTSVGVVLSLLVLLVALFRAERQQAEAHTSWSTGVLIFWGYAVLLTAFGAFSPKKQDRYLLPVFPFLDLLAAIGLLGTLELIAGRLRLSGSSGTTLGYGLSVAALLAQAAFALPHYPYYLTYYNELMGGLPAAVEQVPVGWGEGLDQVARYLNTFPEAERLSVAAVPVQCLAPFFVGHSEQLYTNPPALRADYIVLYINQVQRLAPTPELIHYFRSQKPYAVIPVHGVPYAWIYQGPRFIARSRPRPEIATEMHYGEGMTLLGYDLLGPAPSPVPGAPRVLLVTLHWEVTAEMDNDYTVSLRLLDRAGHIWSQRDGWPVIGLLPTHQWEPETFVRDGYELKLPPGTPPGEYHLEVGVYATNSGQLLPVREGTGKPQARRVVVGPVPLAGPPGPFPTQALELQHPVGADLAPGLRLLGYERGDETVNPGLSLPIILYWQAIQDIQRPYHVRLSLQGEDGRSWGVLEGEPGGGSYPTEMWRKGEVVRDWHDLAVAPGTPSGTYALVLEAVDLTAGVPAGRVILGDVRVEGRPRLFTPPVIAHPLEANLGDRVALLGYEIKAPEEMAQVQAGGVVTVTLYWRALAEMETSYTVFVHLLDGAGRVRAQRDTVPGGGSLPTTGWLPGEVVADEYAVPLGRDMEPGDYTIEVGMYDASTGARLPVVGVGGSVGGDRILLGEVVVR
jgi:hypothetical protein